MIQREEVLERRDFDLFKYLTAELQQSCKILYLIMVWRGGGGVQYCIGPGLMFCPVANSCEGI
jgi:hypothetical protein